jgi:type IV secretion system protein VirD4
VNPAPPLPRSGRLMAGGPNALELIWAIAALTAALAVLTVSAIAWAALSLEAWLTGSSWNHALLDMPRLLIELATRRSHSAIAAAVDVWWRPTVTASLLTVAVIVAAGRAGQAWIDWRDSWRHRQRTHERYTSRVWARPRDLAPLLARTPRGARPEPAAAGRLWVGTHHGRDVLVPARTSVMAIAPTRTGKTSRLVVPNLLRWDGPALVTSVKRDVYDLTVHCRAQIGQTRLFDPTGATGLETVRWSPLLTSTTFPDATRTAGWLTDAAAVEDRHEAAKFWETLATKLLAPMLYAAAATRRTMHDVSHWVDRTAFDEVAKLLDELGDDDACAAWHAIRSLPPETRGSVFGTAMAIFRAFGSPRVRAATSCTPGDTDNTLAIGRMLADNATLYLIAPEYEQAELRPLFVALVQAVYRTAVELSTNLLEGAPLHPPLLLMLDEAGNIAPLKSLPTIAATGAGQGITLMTIWQDRAQIRALYGEAERTVIANHTTTVWLPGSQDLDTLKLLADLIGDQPVATATISAAPDGGLSVSEGSEKIDVAPPPFLRTLPHGQAVLLTGNHPPALIATHAYYQQPRWQRHIPDDVLHHHSNVHTRTPTSTRQRWDATGHPDDLPPAPPERAGRVHDCPDGDEGDGLGEVAVMVCDRTSRQLWGLAAQAVPDHFTLAHGSWQTLQLPATVANIYGQVHADLTDPTVRREVLPLLLELGPAELVAEQLSFPQLHAEWRHLQLTDLLRNVWEGCYPALGDDIRTEPPAGS